MSEELEELGAEEEDDELEQEAGDWGLGSLLLAGAIGFGVGAAMGVLFAPRPGKETRQELMLSAEENVERGLLALRERVDALHQRLGEYLESTDQIAQRLSGNGPPPPPEPDRDEGKSRQKRRSGKTGGGRSRAKSSDEGEEPEHLVES